MREILEAIGLFLKEHGFESHIENDVDEFLGYCALIVKTAGKMVARIFCNNKALIEYTEIDGEGWCCVRRTDPINLADPGSLDTILNHIERISKTHQDSDYDDVVMKEDGWQDAGSIMRALR